jgi:hypothetical protein
MLHGYIALHLEDGWGLGDFGRGSERIEGVVRWVSQRLSIMEKEPPGVNGGERTRR